MIRPASPKVMLCIRCDGILSADDFIHYGRQCHVCIVREHEAGLAYAGDLGHQDRDWYEASPVDLSRAAKAPGRKTRRAA